MTEVKEFLNVVEAAELLRIKPHTLYVWISAHKIPFRKHGKKVVFYRPSLLEWSRRREVAPDPVWCRK